MLRKLTRPQTLVPVAWSIALFGFLLGIADAQRVANLVGRISLPLVLVNYPLVAVYLVLKSLQLRLFLSDIRIVLPWRQLLIAFATGEMCVSIPGGMFLQNYVLSRVAGAGFARSSAATAAMLAVEGGVAFTSLVVLGIPGWDDLRPAILVFFGVAAAAIWTLSRARRLRATLAGVLRTGPLRPVGNGLIEMAGELGSLFRPRVAVRSAVVGGTYLLAISAGLFVVAHGMGEVDFSYRQAVTTYLFAIAMALVSPIPIQLGIVEAGGVGVLQTMGYAPADALAMLLGLRLVWTASVWATCGLILLLLRGEWSAAPVRELATETL